MQIKMKDREFKKLLKEIKDKKTTAKKEIENHIMSKKNFTSKQLDKLKEDIKKYIEKRNKLEKDLDAERAFGNASKTTLRKIEELDRIIHYDEWKETARELARKVSYYEDLLKRHNISYLK